MSDTPKRAAIFFDRDGVINTRIKGGYVRNWQEFDLQDAVLPVLTAVKARGYLAIVVTNQRGVGKGIMTEEALQDIHTRLQDHLNTSGNAAFDDILYCTDADDTSKRRKPSPAMLLEAAEKWDIDLSRSWMVGDSQSDIEAGERAGTRTAYLVTVHSEEIPRATKVIHNLRELLEFI